MNVGELYAHLDAKIPRALSCDWDNDGLSCCPDKSAPVKRVLIALDATEAIVDQAIREGYDTIVTHHPLMFKGIREVNEDSGIPRKVIKMLRAGVTAMSFHTRLDAMPGGVNDTLCDLFGIRNAQIFGAMGEEIGRVGNLEQVTSLDEFCALIKARLEDPLLLVSDAGRPVSRVAVLGGAGKDDIDAAIAAGADTFVSGRLDYHYLVDAPEKGINLVEAGHYYTEFPVCQKLEALIKEADLTIGTKIVSSCRIRVI